MARLSPTDRDLVRMHWPIELRPAFDALFAIDNAMADVVLRAREPQLAAIKLAWWREQLQALDHRAPPAEPRLQAASEQLLPRGLTGEGLAAMEDGWLSFVASPPHGALAGRRGEIIFALASRLLEKPTELPQQGAAWASADLARRTGNPSLLLGQIVFATRSPAQLRPLTALAALAARDHRKGLLEPEGTPGRAWTLIRHRFTGRY